MSGVRCQVSGVRCQLSGVRCQVSHLARVLRLVIGEVEGAIAVGEGGVEGEGGGEGGGGGVRVLDVVGDGVEAEEKGGQVRAEAPAGGQNWSANGNGLEQKQRGKRHFCLIKCTNITQSVISCSVLFHQMCA